MVYHLYICESDFTTINIYPYFNDLTGQLRQYQQELFVVLRDCAMYPNQIRGSVLFRHLDICPLECSMYTQLIDALHTLHSTAYTIQKWFITP